MKREADMRNTLNRRDFLGGTAMFAAAGLAGRASRDWAQIEGGGYELGRRRFGATEIVHAGYFPTVMDVRAEGGKLVVEVWDVWHDKVVGRHVFRPRPA